MSLMMNFDPLSDFDMTGDDDVWYAQLQLFLMCTLRVCLTGQMGDKCSHKEVAMVFFSTFEPISLPRDSNMQSNGITMLKNAVESRSLRLLASQAGSLNGGLDSMPVTEWPSWSFWAKWLLAVPVQDHSVHGLATAAP